MKKIILILTIICLAIVACELQPLPPKIPEYRIGYNGIELAFSIFPEGDIYENEDFIVQLDAWNRGGYDTDNMLVVLNWDTGFFITESSGIFELEEEYPVLHGRSASYPEGEFSTTPTMEFTAKEIFLTDYQRFDFISKLCYEYRTEATLEACIGKKTGYRSCNFKELNKGLNLTRGQGAPLAITSVDESIIEIGDKIKPRFDIVIENKQAGEVFRNPEIYVERFCLGYGIGENILNRFDLVLNLSKAYSYDSRKNQTNSFTCRPTIPKLEDGIANITCVLDEELEAGPSYVTPLVIELVYGYTDKVQKGLTVRRS